MNEVEPGRHSVVDRHGHGSVGWAVCAPDSVRGSGGGGGGRGRRGGGRQDGAGAAVGQGMADADAVSILPDYGGWPGSLLKKYRE